MFLIRYHRFDQNRERQNTTMRVISTRLTISIRKSNQNSWGEMECVCLRQDGKGQKRVERSLFQLVFINSYLIHSN